MEQNIDEQIGNRTSILYDAFEEYLQYRKECIAIAESEALAQLDYESRVADLFRAVGEEQCSSPELFEEEKLEGGYYEPGDEDIDGWE